MGSVRAGRHLRQRGQGEWSVRVKAGGEFLGPCDWQLLPAAELPVDGPDLGHVRGQAGAVRHQHPHLLYLGQRPPVEVRRAHVEMLAVHHPELGVQDTRTDQGGEVDVPDLGPSLLQLLRLRAWRRSGLS